MGANATRVETRVLREIAEAAGRAPSSHNTQPWRFRLDASGIDVRADRTRALPVNDPLGRELVISVGAALYNARAAAGSRGHRADVELLPRQGDPDLLARIEVSPDFDALPEGELRPAITLRRTHRGAFDERALPGGLVQRLASAAEQEGARLRVIDSAADRAAIAALIEEGDRIQFADPLWRRELATWMRPRGNGDGLAVPSLVAPVARFLVKRIDFGPRTGRKDRDWSRTPLSSRC